MLIADECVSMNKYKLSLSIKTISTTSFISFGSIKKTKKIHPKASLWCKANKKENLCKDKLMLQAKKGVK